MWYNREFKSSIVQKGQLLHGIHGLRGIAALSIVLYHVNTIAKIELPVFFQFIGRYFGYSVHLFFILSAFSLMYSTSPRIDSNTWVRDYVIKRFFRIAPLFYFVIIFELLRQAYFGRVLTDSHTLILNLTFSFGLVPFKSIVWGGWAIGVEMLFYVIFPFLILAIKTHRSFFVFLIFSILVSVIIRSVLHAQYLNLTPPPRWDWSYFAFASNICFFGMGLYSYSVSNIGFRNLDLVRWVFLLSSVLILGSLMFFNLGRQLYGSYRLDIILWGIGLSALCISQSIFPNRIIANKVFKFIGERSYSIYLVHPIVIVFLKSELSSLYLSFSPFFGLYTFFICAALVICIVLIFAELTYRLIEVPGIRLGRRLTGRK